MELQCKLNNIQRKKDNRLRTKENTILLSFNDTNGHSEYFDNDNFNYCSILFYNNTKFTHLKMDLIRYEQTFLKCQNNTNTQNL